MPDEQLRMFVFLSELLYRRVVDEKLRPVGKVADFKVGLRELFPKIEALVLRQHGTKTPLALSWELVKSVNGHQIVVTEEAGQKLGPLATAADELLLRDEILDKQVVDTAGAKLERANDLHLLINDGELRLVHVDVGLRGILRRLGWTRAFDAVTNWLFAYQIPQKLISWKYIQPLAHDPEKKRLKLNVTLRKLSEIHPADLADIIEELDKHKASAVFQTLDVESQAEALEELDPKLQKTLIEQVDPSRASDIIEEMAPDEAADLLADISEEKKEVVIRGLEAESRTELTELLTYPEGTAGALMTKDFFCARAGSTVAQAIELLKTLHAEVEMFYYAYVVDENGRLVGALSLRNMLLHDPQAKLEEIMHRHLITVRLTNKQKTVFKKFQKYDYLALPVVDDKGILKGIVTLKDALAAVHPEIVGK